MSAPQPGSMIAYFTGVDPGRAGVGHFCQVPGHISPPDGSPPSPWHLQSHGMPLGDQEPVVAAWPDCVPGRWKRDPRGQAPWIRENCIEGVPRFVRQDGWTLVSMWDRSADERHGSHASFAFDQDLDDAAAMAAVRKHFPRVVARIEAFIKRPLTTEEPTG